MHINLLHRSFYNLDIICGYYAEPFRLTKLTFQEYTMNICLHYLAQYIHWTKCLAFFFNNGQELHASSHRIFGKYISIHRDENEEIQKHIIEKKALSKTRKTEQINFGIANLIEKTFIFIHIFSAGGGGLLNHF